VPVISDFKKLAMAANTNGKGETGGGVSTGGTPKGGQKGGGRRVVERCFGVRWSVLNVRGKES